MAKFLQALIALLCFTVLAVSAKQYKKLEAVQDSLDDGFVSDSEDYPRLQDEDSASDANPSPRFWPYWLGGYGYPYQRFQYWDEGTSNDPSLNDFQDEDATQGNEPSARYLVRRRWRYLYPYGRYWDVSSDVPDVSKTSRGTRVHDEDENSQNLNDPSARLWRNPYGYAYWDEDTPSDLSDVSQGHKDIKFHDKVAAKSNVANPSAKYIRQYPLLWDEDTDMNDAPTKSRFEDY
jgi:hypothetical protein